MASTVHSKTTNTTAATCLSATTDIISITLDRSQKFIQLYHSWYEFTPLFASCVIKISMSGSSFLVTAYNSKLQTILNMTDGEIALYGSLVSVGACFEIVSFYFMSIYGPKLTLLIGAFGTAAGYIVLAALASQDIHDNNSISLALVLGFMIGFFSGWTSAAAYVTAATNCFPQHRGAILGLLQASYSLTGAFYTVMYEAFRFSIPNFLLFVGLFGLGAVLLAYPSNHLIVGEENKTDPAPVVPLAVLLVSSCILIICSAITSLEGLYISASVLFFCLVVGVGILSLMITSTYGYVVFDPWLIHFNKHADQDIFEMKELDTVSDQIFPSATDVGQESRGKDGLGLDETSALLHIQEEEHENIRDDISELSDADTLGTSENVGHGKSYTLVKAICTWKFWVLFYFIAVLGGVSFSILFNIDYIIDAHSPSDSDDDVHATLKANSEATFSVFNAFGRVLFGLGSDYVVVQGGWSRYDSLSIACFLQLMQCIILNYVTTNALFFGFTMVIGGLACGGSSVLIDTIVLDTFGPEHFGVIIGAIYIGNLIGILVINSAIATYFYDRYESDDGNCFGRPQCFTWTFWIFAMLSFVSLVLSVWNSYSIKLAQKKKALRE